MVAQTRTLQGDHRRRDRARLLDRVGRAFARVPHAGVW
jgi:hypothetical protein